MFPCTGVLRFLNLFLFLFVLSGSLVLFCLILSKETGVYYKEKIILKHVGNNSSVMNFWIVNNYQRYGLAFQIFKSTFTM